MVEKVENGKVPVLPQSSENDENQLHEAPTAAALS